MKHQEKITSFDLRRKLLFTTLRKAARKLTALPPQKVRARLDMLARFSPPAVGIKRRKAQVGGVHGEWFSPRKWNEQATFVFLHGGGYAFCSSNTHGLMVSEIVKSTGARGFCVNYRLAPEHPFPAGLDDCEKVYQSLSEGRKTSEKLFIVGESAGGALAISTMMRIREKRCLQPTATVLMSPWVDLSCEGETITKNAAFDYLHIDALHFYADLYLNGEHPGNMYASPINGSFRKFPPLLIQTGGLELFYSDILRLKEKAERHGVDVTFQTWPGMVHSFQGLAPLLLESRQALSEVGKFISHHAHSSKVISAEGLT